MVVSSGLTVLRTKKGRPWLTLIRNKGCGDETVKILAELSYVVFYAFTEFHCISLEITNKIPSKIWYTVVHKPLDWLEQTKEITTKSIKVKWLYSWQQQQKKNNTNRLANSLKYFFQLNENTTAFLGGTKNQRAIVIMDWNTLNYKKVQFSPTVTHVSNISRFQLNFQTIYCQVYHRFEQA